MHGATPVAVGGRDRHLEASPLDPRCFGVLLLGLTAGGGLWYWGGVAGRRKTTRETCPLCLGQGSLESEKRPLRRTIRAICGSFDAIM